ncbi:MAG: hypothetical protein Kow00107_08840 [Planctomycetota bacterium]
MRDFDLVSALRALFASPHPATAGVCVPDAMFSARRQQRYDDYDDYEEERPRGRRSSVVDRAARRTGGVGARKSSNDSLKIGGIIVGILIAVVAIAYFSKPGGDIETTGASKAPGLVWALNVDINYFKQKLSPDKLFPPADNYWVNATFIKEFSQWTNSISNGYQFYYSPSPDRKSFVVACEPEKVGQGVKCYYAIRESLEADPKIYEAAWAKPEDMSPPENGKPPVATNAWTEIAPPTQN